MSDGLTEMERAADIEAEVARLASGWEPIESAPRNGKLFDAWCVSEDGSLSVRFTDVAMREDLSGFGFLLNNGHWEYLEREGEYPAWTPTHWMPLPAAPGEIA